MRRPAGFTLLELLVALAVFGLMSAMAYGGLRAILDAGRHNDAARDGFAELQRALLFLEQDLSQLAARPVRDSLGGDEPALSAADGRLALTRLDGLGLTAGGLVRIEYRLQDGRLLRLRQPVLDRVPGSRPPPLTLLHDCRGLRLRFLPSADGDWQDHWPAPDAPADALPAAIELTLDSPRWPGVRRLIRVGA